MRKPSLTTFPILIAALLACVRVAPCLAEGDAKVTLPKDIGPLPPALQEKMKVLIQAAQKYRGLTVKHDVPSGSLDEPTLKKKMIASFQDELPESKILPLETSLKAFGFIPESMKLSKYYPELLTSQVGGYYDPKQKYLVIVEREGGLLGKEARKQYGEDMSARMEETVLVHELTHALQDQYFDLGKFTDGDPMADETAAHLALVEGDATLTMYDYFLQTNIENMPGLEAVIGQLVSDPKQMLDMSPDMPGGKEMADAPGWFRDNMMFTYLQGFLFCCSVRKTGGQKLLDYAFTKDPPRSTEQILHPEKWHTNRDNPIEIVWPDLSAQLPGYKLVKEGQIGEQSIRVLLRDRLKDQHVVEQAAAGWGGDRFGVYEKDGKRVLAWITDWDTNKDAREFFDAARHLGQDWSVDTPAPRRVTLVRGELDSKALDALYTALGKATANAPDNKNIDLAALHITLADAGGMDGGIDAGTLDKLGGMLKNLTGDGKDSQANPRSQSAKDNKNPAGKVDIDSVLNKIAENGGGTDIGGVNMGEMLKNPAVQSMVKGMLAQDRPDGKLADDGKSYTNEGAGFSIHAPRSEPGWKVDPKPPIPMASVSIISPDGGAQIVVVSQALPMSVPIETMAPFLEMGPKMAMKDYKKIGGGMIGSGASKGVELEFEGEQPDSGGRLHNLLHVYFSGSTMLMVTGACPVESWPKYSKAIGEALDSFKLTTPGAGGAKGGKQPSPDEKEPLKE